MSMRRTASFFAALSLLYLMAPVLISCAGEKQEPDPRPVASAEETQKHNYQPEEGIVPDAETAITIAVAVWIPIYGREQIESEKPYRASLQDGVWYVTGSMPAGPGGVAEAEIARENGCVLRISHGE